MFDTLIQGALIIDGTGAEAHQGNIAIKDGKITVLKNGEKAEANHVIDATGMCVCPGFIDAHSHGDSSVGKDFNNISKSTQGITTEVAGQCGASRFPYAKDPELFRQQTEIMGQPSGDPPVTDFIRFRNHVESASKTTNIMQLVGHRALRLAAMGCAPRTATAKELDTMKGLLREAMEGGCCGMSTGLTYPPSGFADEREVIELLKVIAPFDGIYTSHIRNEADGVVDSVKEVLDCAAAAGVRSHISHHKICGVENWGRSIDTLGLIDSALANGQEVAMDMYPYTACNTALSVCLPLTEFGYDLKTRIQRLKDSEIREELKTQMRKSCRQYSQLSDFTDVMLSYCSAYPEYNGMTIAQVATERNADPFDTYFDIVADCNFRVNAVFFAMDETDMCRIFMHDRTMIGTDGLVYSMTGITHPRGYGTFPKAINYFVREKKLVTLEKAIYKMSGLTAQWYGIKNKGFIRDGYDADLVIFDPNTIAEGNSFKDSNKPAVGISHVIVNGQIVCQNGILTGKYPGKMILRNQ